ncbi:hypothetical protein, partial [Chromatium okenii]|uniref:hypothetical protein n=1 Tax=Chromatium okenii TaxID=61644 RepID=UPI001F5B28CC
LEMLRNGAFLEGFFDKGRMTPLMQQNASTGYFTTAHAIARRSPICCCAIGGIRRFMRQKLN